MHVTSHHTDKNPYITFLHFLDRYKSIKYISETSMNILHSTIQEHFDCQYKNYLLKDNIFFYDSQRVITDFDISSSLLMITEYEKWQTEHEMKIETTPLEHVIINTKLQSMDDLLGLLETHPYDCTKTYNIDLKHLHSIKEELRLLNNMVGVSTLKESVLRQLLYFIQGFADSNGDYKHTILTGPPGTGKTEISKLLGKMYSKIGVLKNNTFKKVTRVDLVGGYLGQTAIKTKKVLDECSGGVLFIDEAYSLQTNDSFAKECVDTLCEALSDRKNDFMVIIAGYKNELNETIFKINAGLKSRFIWNFSLEPYSYTELYLIFLNMVNTNGWSVNATITQKWFKEKKSFFEHNGRSMELLFSYCKMSHSQRIYGESIKEQKILTSEDLGKGFQLYQQNKTEEKENSMFGLYI